MTVDGMINLSNDVLKKSQNGYTDKLTLNFVKIKNV